MTTTTAPRRASKAKRTTKPARAARAAAVDLPPHPTRGRKLPAEILDDAEVEALLRACSMRSPSGLRDRALIAFLAGSGLRISEALALRPCDVQREAGSVRVLHGKGDRSRTSAVAESALVLLDRWLDVRAGLGAKRSAPVFCCVSAGKVGGAMSASAVRQMLARRRERAGIERRVHAHGLRHKHASDLVARGLPLNVIGGQLGHAHVSTTSLYVQRLNPRHVVEAVRSALD
jgi:site-specific recombinase XerD